MPGQSFSYAVVAGLRVVTETSRREILPRVSPGFPRVDARRCVASVCAVFALAACSAPNAASPPRAPIMTSASSAGGAPVAVSRSIAPPTGAATIEEIFARARVDFAEKRFLDAARGFDRIVELDPDGPHARDAWIF